MYINFCVYAYIFYVEDTNINPLLIINIVLFQYSVAIWFYSGIDVFNFYIP